VPAGRCPLESISVRPRSGGLSLTSSLGLTTIMCTAGQMTALLLPYSLDRAGSEEDHTLPLACRLPEALLDAEANGRETSFTRHCPGRMDISPRSACVYRDVIPDMLLQTPAAHELLPGGELSEQSW
jgi:hypothetical protein